MTPPSPCRPLVVPKLCFASLTFLPILNPFPRLRFAKRRLARRIPKRRLGTTEDSPSGVWG